MLDLAIGIRVNAGNKTDVVVAGAAGLSTGPLQGIDGLRQIRLGGIVTLGTAQARARRYISSAHVRRKMNIGEVMRGIAVSPNDIRDLIASVFDLIWA